MAVDGFTIRESCRYVQRAILESMKRLMSRSQFEFQKLRHRLRRQCFVLPLPLPFVGRLLPVDLTDEDLEEVAE